MTRTATTADFEWRAVLPFVENHHVEFKQVTGGNPTSAIANKADEYAVGFLNCEGGVIYWGVEDKTRKIVGVEIPPRDRDQLIRTVTEKLLAIQPAKDPSIFKFEVCDLRGAPEGSNLVLCQLTVPKGAPPDCFSTAGGDLFIRTHSLNKRLTGSALIDFIDRRRGIASPAGHRIIDLRVQEHVRRVRRVFEAHKLAPTHWARYFKSRNAPFSVKLTDTLNDEALLAWLDEEKIIWIANEFSIQRGWIDGDDTGIHFPFFFDQKPGYFFSTIRQQVEDTDIEIAQDAPAAFFIRWGQGEEWAKSGHGVFFVLRIPTVRMNDQIYVYKYVSDFEPYGWGYVRTNLQLRAWVRLLVVDLKICCFGCDISYEDGSKFLTNNEFLQEAISSRAIVRTHIWYPEDEALLAKPGANPNSPDTVSQIKEYLRANGLPHGPLRPNST